MSTINTHRTALLVLILGLATAAPVFAAEKTSTSPDTSTETLPEITAPDASTNASPTTDTDGKGSNSTSSNSSPSSATSSDGTSGNSSTTQK